MGAGNPGPLAWLTCGLCFLWPSLAGAQLATTRVSVGSGGIQANHLSGGAGPAISASGRWVVFDSSASNLVPGDTNDTLDVFVHDRQTGATTRVSVASDGTQGNGVSYGGAISADGRWVVFSSGATTLVPGDTGVLDVYLHDRQTATTTRVSAGPGGAPGDMDSRSPGISADGRWILFDSLASNLVADDTNGQGDVFVYDREVGTIARVSVGPGGVQGNHQSFGSAMSADGRVVLFGSVATNLVSDDTNGMSDLFVYDRQTATTARIVENVQGGWSRPAVSGDGRLAVFQSATSHVPADTNGKNDVYAYDRQTGAITWVSVGFYMGATWSEFPAISADGRWVAFNSPDAMLPGDANGYDDVFVFDLLTATMRRVSVGPANAEGNFGSTLAALSADGRWVAFTSWASNLVPGDTNGYGDVFVHDVLGTTPLAPTGLAVQSVVGNMLTVRWASPAFGPTPTGFVLEGGVNPGEVLASLPTGSLAPTFSFVAPPGSYYVRVRALNGAARSAASNEVRVHVDVPVAPSAPANLLGLVNGSTVALTWTNTFSGGAPTAMVLDVRGPFATSVVLGVSETATFTNVPDGTYELVLRAQDAAGSSPPTRAVVLTVPGPCSGPPIVPIDVSMYLAGRTLFLGWAPGAAGPAPTAYVVIVTGASLASVVTPDSNVSGTLAPGTYGLSVVAVNPCGASAGTAVQTVLIP